MKAFLIVLILAIAMVVGQVLVLRPNPRDKALMALREAARRQGLQPRLLPRPEWLRVEPGLRLVPCYTLFLEEGSRPLPHWLAERQPDGRWEARIGSPTLLAGLEWPSESAAFLALEVRANALSLYWKETPDPSVVPALLALLRDIAEKIKQKQ